jgi:molybdopterin molybdotransferase
MRSVADHQLAVESLLASLTDRAPEVLTDLAPMSLARLGRRVLADTVTSPIDLPPFDNSQMDGFAVRVADVTPGVALPVGEPIPAGAEAGALEVGEARPIMTGAGVPAGADAIVRIEASVPPVFPPAGAWATVAFSTAPEPGDFVRRRGSDVAAGAELLPAGTVLGPAQWGVLAAAGVTEVSVLAPLRVLLVSTGDELQESGSPLEPGRIYGANSTSLAVALADCGVDLVGVETVTDDAATLRRLLTRHSADVDLVITTGGVSKGAYEVVRDVLAPAGVDFVSVALQPGGPQGLGLAALGQERVPVIALPGNPVSALVSFEMFVRPVIRGLHGLPPHRPIERAPLAEAVDSSPVKLRVRRGVMDAAGMVHLVGGAGSHLLHGYASSTVLVHLPAAIDSLEAGDEVEIWRIDD